MLLNAVFEYIKLVRTEIERSTADVELSANCVGIPLCGESMGNRTRNMRCLNNFLKKECR